VIPWLRNFTRELLYDQRAFQAHAAAACFLVGAFLATGGVLPGTNTVLLDVGPSWAALGRPLQALGVWLAAGGQLPGLKKET
jgi:hypothetical protein